MPNDIDTFYPTNKDEWRTWLKNNHRSQSSVWVILYKKNTQIPTIPWSDAVDEALCFGWIDSVKKTINSEKYKQYFSPRKPKSTWSKINKEKVDYLIEQGLMTPAGLDCINIAKQNGSWTMLDSIDNLVVPKDLEKELEASPASTEYFSNLSNSSKKIILYWIMSAKRTETRAKRIRETVESASKNMKPNQFK